MQIRADRQCGIIYSTAEVFTGCRKCTVLVHVLGVRSAQYLRSGFFGISG